MKVPHATKAVIACGVLYVLVSFLSWQRHSFGPAGVYAQTLWHGFGVVVALTALAYLGWELARALGVEVVYDSVSSGLISGVGAAVMLFFNLIVFLTWGQYRTWAAWLGILLALAICGAATWRARGEGVELPSLSGRLSFGGGTFSLPSATPAPAAELPDVQPVEA